jgi:predicted CXXCH cytochrome family protein
MNVLQYFKFLALLSSFFFTSFASATAIRGTGIVNSMHNFSVFWMSNSNGELLDQVCIFCHTPHNSDRTVVEAPLWNHTLSKASYTPYTSSTMKAIPSQPNGISKLCLSCHDGTVAIDSYGTNTPASHIGLDQLRVGDFSPEMNLGTDLTGDHPISIVYDTALSTLNPKLRDPETATIIPGINSATGTIKKALLDSSGQIQCTSCHDIHNSQGINKLLKVNNSGSALCLTCHNI